MEELYLAAKRRYAWLWISPIFTGPTYFFLYFNNFDHLTAVFCSSLWHLVVLIFLRPKKQGAFVGWHQTQVLILILARTAVIFFLPVETYAAYPLFILILLWFFGTRWGQQQALRGDCTLMRWRDRQQFQLLQDKKALFDAFSQVGKRYGPTVSRGSHRYSCLILLSEYLHNVKFDQLPQDDPLHVLLTADNLLHIFRYSPRANQKQFALHKLEQLGLTESL